MPPVVTAASSGPLRPARDYSHAWRALRHRNFRLFVSGQSISLIGTWMTRIATAWLVYRLTGSALLLGTVSFAGQIPTFLLAPFAGVLVDRWDRQRVLIATQVIAMLQSFALAGLTLAHRITIPELVWLSIIGGLVNAFDMPARQSFLVQMVGGGPGSAGDAASSRADLSNAIAINSSMVNLARLIGPAIAGVIIAVSSEGWCFLIDGISYVAVVVSLLAMHVVRQARADGPKPLLITQLREGWTYVRGFIPIRTILLLFALISLMGMPYMVLMPVFAAQILHGGPHTLGFLMGTAGAGSLLSALMMVLRRSVRGLTRMIPIAAAIFGAGLIGFGFSHVLWISLALMAVVGFGMMQGLTASNTIIQTLVPEDKRGRVMSYYTVAFVGMAPFGSLLAGALAHKIGAQYTVMLSGSACLAGAAWFWSRMPEIRREMRPIYEQMGIMPARAVPEPVAAAETLQSS